MAVLATGISQSKLLMSSLQVALEVVYPHLCASMAVTQGGEPLDFKFGEALPAHFPSLSPTEPLADQLLKRWVP